MHIYIFVQENKQSKIGSGWYTLYCYKYYAMPKTHKVNDHILCILYYAWIEQTSRMNNLE